MNLLTKKLVDKWGERNLSNIELEDKIATAAEKAPTEDVLIQSLREVLSNIKHWMGNIFQSSLNKRNYN